MENAVSVRWLKACWPARIATRFAVVVSAAGLLYAAPVATDGQGAQEPRKAAAPATAQEPRKPVATASSRRSGIEATRATADFRTMHAIFAQAHASAFKQVGAGDSPDLFKDAGRYGISNLLKSRGSSTFKKIIIWKRLDSCCFTN